MLCTIAHQEGEEEGDDEEVCCVVCSVVGCVPGCKGYAQPYFCPRDGPSLDVPPAQPYFCPRDGPSLDVPPPRGPPPCSHVMQLTNQCTKRAKLAMVEEGPTKVVQVVDVGCCWVWCRPVCGCLTLGVCDPAGCPIPHPPYSPTPIRSCFVLTAVHVTCTTAPRLCS